jgi:protein farnesyltransferase subunit beta
MAMASSSSRVGGGASHHVDDGSLTSRMAHTALGAAQQEMGISDLYTLMPEILDPLSTVTSVEQISTAEACVPLLAGEDGALNYNAHGVPRLRRERHIAFLRHTLGQLPAPFVAADARPWMFYWALNGLSLLGADVSEYADRLVATAQHMQNESGGFGGGFGQRSHLATTYAMVLALSIVGTEAAYEVIDRRAMWKWLCALKQANGGFQMSLGGEVDVRGAYCASVVISLLNIPLSLTAESAAADGGLADLLTGLDAYVRRCKTRTESWRSDGLRMLIVYRSNL